MKVTKVKEELKQGDIAALAAKLNDLRRELFTLRLNAATAHVKDYSQYKKLRRDVARVLTYLRQKAI
jgi:large subunit ribosomal protein L29